MSTVGYIGAVVVVLDIITIVGGWLVYRWYRRRNEDHQ